MQQQTEKNRNKYKISGRLYPSEVHFKGTNMHLIPNYFLSMRRSKGLCENLNHSV